jgi:peptidoglycan/xylan/chitin deacetylase (PgdA/CDA1 family)
MIPILMYHQIDAAAPRGTPMRGLTVTPKAFNRQMLALKMLGFQGLSMRDLEPYLDGKRFGKVVGLTFDDGYANNHQYALPVLSKHGFTATCYAVSDMMDGRNEWDQGLGIPQKPLMGVQQWRDWIASGMDVGSHTRRHCDLTKIDKELAWQEIDESKRELERILGCEVRHFCYPYGKYEDEHLEMVKEAGYFSATTTNYGKFQEGDSHAALRRIMVKGSMNLVNFVWKTVY